MNIMQIFIVESLEQVVSLVSY